MLTVGKLLTFAAPSDDTQPLAATSEEDVFEYIGCTVCKPMHTAFKEISKLNENPIMPIKITHEKLNESRNEVADVWSLLSSININVVSVCHEHETLEHKMDTLLIKQDTMAFTLLIKRGGM
ncbi:hypothetical protein Csa_016302 [Cucumis sativus]|uniref:Uncharacterized protein n=1 Tax=Cucumis sativus TaxID=3659 RepID=A0A0A0K727_CUCSA|nr:hypothetical protein Csa_016302 [Cucumis sativus]